MYSPAIMKIMVKYCKGIAITGRGSDICLREGFLPVPVHYYSPIPDTSDLVSRKVWDFRNELVGIDFREQEQLMLLRELGQKWGTECKWSRQPTGGSTVFYLDNPSFSFGCAASTHAMIRQFKPSQIIEIGSGMSSLVIAAAIRANHGADGVAAHYCIIDPYPSDFVRKLPEVSELKQRRVELLDPEFFDRLDGNSILFIDSGHTVRIGGDVNYLYLDVLPRLAPGVIVHAHDISLPYEYSKTYALSERFLQFWTEQYLLQAFLCYNSEFEILLAMNYLMTDHPDEFRAAFPHYDSTMDAGSGSFWMRRKIEST
jgi:hypothetical protein